MVVHDEEAPRKDKPEEQLPPDESASRQPQQISEVTIADGLLLKTGVVAHKQGPSGESIDVTEEDTKKITAESKPGGLVDISARAPGRHGEEGTLAVCRILVQRLNADGAAWSEPVDRTDASDDTDCEARDGDKALKIQVVRAQTESYWRERAQRGEVVGRHHASEMADVLRAAVRRKEMIPPARRGFISLALDALDTPEGVLHLVVDAFRKRHARDVRALGFAGVWIVGPTADLVHRLDAVDEEGPQNA